MTGSQESEDFDADDEGDETGDDDGLDVDRVIKDMEIAKRRSAKGGEPAWRRLERRMEQQHTQRPPHPGGTLHDVRPKRTRSPSQPRARYTPLSPR